jgi:hypothetical protein
VLTPSTGAAGNAAHFKETAAAKAESDRYMEERGLRKKEPSWMYSWVTLSAAAVVVCLLLITFLLKEDANHKVPPLRLCRSAADVVLFLER